MLCSLRCLSRGWFWTKGCGFESLLLLYLTRSWDIRGIRDDFKEFLIQCDGWWRKDKANWEVFEWQLFRTSLNLQSSDNKRFIWLCNNTEFASRLGVGNEQLHSSVLMLLHQVIASRRSQFVIKYASRLFDSNELRRVPSCESQDQVIKYSKRHAKKSFLNVEFESFLRSIKSSCNLSKQDIAVDSSVTRRQSKQILWFTTSNKSLFVQQRR